MTTPPPNQSDFLPLTETSWDLAAEQSLWRDICYNSFFWFCDYALGYGRPDFLWWTPRVHQPFCDWFESHVLAWEADRKTGSGQQRALMVIVHREFGKTMIITKAGQLWMHLRNPDLSSYIGSSTVTRAQFFFSPLKAILQGNDPDSRFSWLYGDWYDPSRTWTSFEIVHGARKNLARTEPSMGTWGVETGLTGFHPDVGFLDDPVDYEKMGTDSLWLGKVNTHLASLSPVFRSDSLFVYTGTRYHDSDPIGESLRNAGAATITGMPMRGVVPRENGKWHVYFRSARDENGTPTYPENWSEQRLREYEEQNPLQYAAQLLNDPNTGRHVPIVAEQIDMLWVDPRDVPKNLKISIHIDTAFKTKESVARGDESVIIVCGHDLGTGDVYYLEGHGSNLWRIEDFNNHLIMLLQRLRSTRRWPFILTDEAEIGGKFGAWELTLQSWCHSAGIPSPRIELLHRGNKKKVIRIVEACSYWVDGHMKLVRGATNVDKLIDQMLRIGTSRTDDWADACADAFNAKVYVPMRRGSDQVYQPNLNRPWDRELQDSDELARQAYDSYFTEDEVGRPPI